MKRRTWLGSLAGVTLGALGGCLRQLETAPSTATEADESVTTTASEVDSTVTATDPTPADRTGQFEHTPPEETPAETTVYTNETRDGEEWLVVPREVVTLSGLTPRDPGTELSVDLRSQTASAPFLFSAAPTVDADHRFTFVVDFSDIAADVRFEILVEDGDERLLTFGNCETQ